MTEKSCGHKSKSFQNLLDRLVTFMLYLNGPEAGGNTVFSQAGISVKPVLGSALFWFNQGAQNNFDSRIRHSGS